ncbi:MAG TPA: tRNA pseudouridine(38-40) synthase TruA [Sulfurospirillum sp. UBA11407]|nr:MAG TPA: tRNA pseudouridine(38-40) synthase TruA [Sulfurospirillum sp. UBA11407]
MSYDGSHFNGFQIQNEDTKTKTVAGVLTKALLRLGIESKVVGSGRTDKGVHALSQVCHIDIPSFWENLSLLHRNLNRLIAPHILIKSIEKTSDAFHARFSAKKRLYRYILTTNSSPFYHAYTLHVKSVDTKTLDTTLKNFVGIHNFGFFKKNGSDNGSDIREIYKAGAYEYKGFIIVYFLGNGFLRSQVRLMVDFALKINQGKFCNTNLKEQLELQKRYSSAKVSPNGLYLSKIYY